MALNHPYDPRFNAKLHIPKQTEEDRRARATPLENLKGLRYRTVTPDASASVSVPAESIPQAPAPQHTAAPQDALPVSVPAPDCTPTALEVVQAGLPEIFTQGENGGYLDHDDDHRAINAGHRADGQGSDRVHHPEANIAVPDPPSSMGYEENDILAYANVVSFYSRPRRNATPPETIRQRSGGLRFATSLIPHHSSG
jgi:hypothetical protein